MIFEEQFPVPRYTAASKIGNSVISLLWQLWCRCNTDHNKFSSSSNTTVVAIFPKLCLWRRSLCSNLRGIGPEKLYRATLSWHLAIKEQKVRRNFRHLSSLSMPRPSRAHSEALHPWVSGSALFEIVTMFLLTCCSLGMIQPWELKAFSTESGQMTSSPSIQPLFKAGTWKRKLKQIR